MKRFTFLPSEISLALVLILTYSFYHYTLGIKVFVILVCSTVFYAFRRASIPYRDTLKNNGEIYLSPVHGIVESIRRDTTSWEDQTISHEVRITIGGWDEKGLYLPTAGEVTYLKANKGRKLTRRADSQEIYGQISELAHTDLVLTSKNQTKTLMRFIDCKYGKRPTIWMKSGDRGRGAACFGNYPFGGTLIIYLPQNSDILVFEKERVVPGQSVIAALKDLK